MKFRGSTILRKLPFYLVLALACITACSDRYRIEHFNRNAGDPGNRADAVIESLGIGGKETIADLGAGGGYFTLRFARLTSSPVYAVDLNMSYLDYIGESARKAGLKNVVTLMADPDDSRLPAGSIDLVFMRNVFHQIENREKYFHRLANVLKPGGRIAIVEYTGRGIIQRFAGHNTDPAHIKNTMEKAGYYLHKEHRILDEQSFMEFRVRGR